MPNTAHSTKIAAIVLGGGLNKIEVHGQMRYEPEAQAKSRLDKAYALFTEGKVDYIISTGKYSVAATVDPDVTGPRTEAEVGKQYLIARAKVQGADASGARRIEEAILCEDQSIDTISNAWYAKKLCLEPHGITSCILVTSDYHMERARVIFEWVLGPRYTITCVEAPSPLSGAERERRNQFENMLTDYVKTHLISVIAPGDDEALQRFMETEHLRMFSGIAPPNHAG
ncbi:MAG: YdcF family protein [Anaerolineae bacterium]